MKQLRLVTVEVRDLIQGMYIAELDRPWLGSPFLIEGFTLEDPDDLERLQSLCAHVQVDATRSHDSVRARLMALADLPPRPPEEERRQSRLHATASLVESAASAGATAAVRGPGIVEELGTIVSQTLHGRSAGQAHSGRPDSAAWQSNAGADAARQRRGAGLTSGREAPEDASAIPRAYVSAANESAGAARRGGRYRPGRHAGQVELDLDADVAQLGGSPVFDFSGPRILATPQLRAADPIVDNARSQIDQFYQDVYAKRDLDLGPIDDAVAQMAGSIADNPDPLRWLTALKREDNYAYKHAIDCSVHLMSFGRHLGYARETMHALGMAGLLLDIGKIHVPEEIRLSTRRLTPGQFAAMREHVTHSIDILHKIEGLSDKTKVLEAVAQHHERIDGSGYPYGLNGTEISPLASMAGIVDTYAALTTTRPHAQAVTVHEALQALDRRKGREFNESLVEQFIQCIGLYPVGTLVKLNTGEIGVVVNQNRVRRLKPTVMLLLDANENEYAYPGVVNLMLDPTAFGDTPYAIVCDLPPGDYDLDLTEFYIQAA